MTGACKLKTIFCQHYTFHAMDPSQLRPVTRRTKARRESASPVNSHTSGASASASSKSSSLTTNPLPTWIVKQLAEDIEGAGGLDKFDEDKSQGLADLLDYRTIDLKEPVCYGQRGSEQRRKISQKVRRWKSKRSANYLKDLAKLGVTPSAARKGPNHHPKGAIAREQITEGVDSYLQGLESLTIKADSREEEVYMSDLEEEDFHQEPPRKRNKPRAIVLQGTPQVLPAARESAKTTMSSSNKIIKIDPRYPGKELIWDHKMLLFSKLQ
jgi:hypothetical protein